MKTFFRWTIRLIVILAIVIVALPVAATLLIDQDDIKRKIDETVFNATGRHLQVNGPIGFTPGLRLGVYAEDVRFENASWASKESAVTADKLSAEIALMDLLGGVVNVVEVAIRGFNMWMETNADGQINLVEPSDKPAAEPGSIPMPEWLRIGKVLIDDSKIVSLGKESEFEIALDQFRLVSESREAPLRVDGDLSLQKTLFELSGALGSLDSWFNRQPSETDLRIQVGERGRISAKGTVGDVLAWKNVDLALDTALPELAVLSPLVPELPVAINDIAASARLVQPGAANTMGLEALDGQLLVAGITAELSGGIESLTKVDGLNLSVKGAGAVDRALLPEQVPASFEPTVDLAATITGSAFQPLIAIDTATLAIDGATVNATGSLENPAGGWQEPIAIVVDVESVPTLGEAFDIQLPALGGVKGTADIRRDDSGFSLSNIQVNNRDSNVDLALTGAIDKLADGPTGKLDIAATAQPGFFKDSGYALPVTTGPVVATAELLLDAGKMQLKVSDAKTTIPGAKIAATGGIPDLTKPTNMRFDLNGQVERLTELGKAFNVELPEVNNIDVNAALIGEAKVFSLTDIAVDTGAADGLDLKANGSIRNLGESLSADIDLKGAISIERLEKLVPAVKDALAPVRDELSDIDFETKLVAASAKAWSLKEIAAHTRWIGADLDVAGAIPSFQPLGGEFAVALRGSTNRQSALLKGYPMPDLDSVDITLDLALPIEENGIRNLKGNVVAGTAELDFNGDIRSLSPLSGEGFNIKLRAKELSSLVANEALIATGNPVEVNVDVALDPGEISIAGKATVGDSDLDGAVTVITGERERPLIKAVIESKNIDLLKLLPEPEPAQVAAKPEKKPGGKVVSDESIVPDGLKKIDADVKLDIASLNTRFLKFNSLNGKIDLNNGALDTRLTASRGEGRVGVDVKLQEGGDNRFDVEIGSFPLDDVSAFSEGKILVGGQLDLDFNLAGRADSISGLLSKGAGDLKLDVRNSRMQSNALDLVGGDLLLNIFSKVNPFDKSSATMGLECAAVHLVIGDGKVRTESGLAMKTDAVTLLGGGEVSFPEESMRIEIAPKARKGLGVSASSIAKMVRVGGTLSSPSVEADAKGLLKSGAAIGAALASGGLSLFAQGLLDRFQANSDVCALARGDVEKKQVLPAPAGSRSK